MEYKVLYGDNAQALTQSVTEAIAEGWVPQGGVAVSLNNNDEHGGHVSVIFAQAMTKG